MRFTAALLAAIAIALVDARPQDLTVPTVSLPTSGSATDPLPTTSPSLTFSLPGPISVSHTTIFSTPSGSESLPGTIFSNPSGSGSVTSLSQTTLTSPTRSTTVTSASRTSSGSSTAQSGASSSNAAVPAGFKVEGMVVGFVAGLMALSM